MQNSLLIFIHVIAAAIAIGSILFSIFIFLPVLRKNEDLFIESSLELKMMDRLVSTVLGCMFTLIITGVYFLHPLQPHYQNKLMVLH